MVILTHVPWQSAEYNKFLFGFWRDMAVPIFMIISGYVYSKSFDRDQINSLSRAYLPKYTLPKLIRYTVPFVIFFIAEIINLFLIRKTPMPFLKVFALFLQGGAGAGSYYYPILVQFVFLFPLIYFTVKKYKRTGFFICLAVNAAYELLCWAYGINDMSYRLLVFRYIMVIAYGCYLALPDYKPNLVLCTASLILGFLFILGTRYLGYTPTFIRFWISTCFVACLFILPLTMLLLKNCNFGFKPLEIIGKASYHIFLTQMFYFYDPSLIYNAISNRWIEMVVSLVICIFGGVLFYYIEKPLTATITKKMKLLLNKQSHSTQ